MKAAISGQSGVALLDDGREQIALWYDGTSEPQRVEPFRTGFDADLRGAWRTECEDEAEGARLLKSAWSQDRAILLAAMSIDQELEASLRLDAAKDLEELVTDSRVRDFVLGRFVARPQVNLGAARDVLEVSVANQLHGVFSIFDEVVRSQERIREMATSRGQ